jgi:cytidylate kinase
MIITIDGPAGTGKSTAARGLAERLGFHYLDTGAMYRAVGLACLRASVDPQDAIESARIASEIRLEQDGACTRLDGADGTDEIRTAAAASAASMIAQHPGVRDRLVDLQRRIASRGDFVCEGRDQGTVAFPDAPCKFFVTATPEVRARRRCQELLDRGESVSLEEMLAQQDERDRRDEQRAVAPLRPARDAIVIDTTSLTMDEVLDRLESIVRETMCDS